ncbi:hypothetical protein P692DRAFT_201730859 [Suillus brevipes Sb2]|nr:hypothetical protein P692DRAFT_201730859 [Suillus brevipes Sb2]
MYLVGIIPGPTKPSTDQINHFLKLLVDDLLPFWNPGVTFSRTAKYPDGRIIRIALIPIVCDLPAAKQIAGFSGIGSKFFCSYCLLPSYDIDNVDRSQWPPRDVETHRKHATAYRDAATPEERQRLFDQFGVRWTELLRLPYWDPISFTVVESMHILYLRILRYHCRVAWRMNVDLEDGEIASGEGTKSFARPSDEDMCNGAEALATGTFAALDTCTKPVLYHLCQDRDLRRASTKRALIKTLLNWVRERPSKPFIPPRPSKKTPQTDAESARLLVEGTATVSDVSLLRFTKPILASLCDGKSLRRSGNKSDLVGRLLDWRGEQPPLCAKQNQYDNNVHDAPANFENSPDSPRTEHSGPTRDMNGDQSHCVVLGQSLVTEIRKDMLRTELPTWVSKAPKALGSTAQGKLSADQWRAACTINMSITLIRLWGGKNGVTKAMLNNFMDLVTAVELGCMFIISPGHINQYEFYMLRYLENFKDLYKTLRLVPSHHIALHLGEFLCSFGPVHAWRAFAFERYNYLLQRENTNGKFGEIELTMMNHTCRVANVRTLIQEDHIRSAICEMVDAYSNFANEDRRGTRIRDVLQSDKTVTTQGQTHPASKEVILEDKIYSALLQLIDTTEEHRYVAEGVPRSSRQLFLSRKAVPSNRILICGVSYRPSDFSHCDSNIIFRSASDSRPEAGRIVKIFLHHRYSPNQSIIEETFLAVQPLIPLSDIDIPRDPYRQYPIAGGFLCYNQYHNDRRIIRPSGVICHFAKTIMRIQSIRQPCVHVLPLDRVGGPVTNELYLILIDYVVVEVYGAPRASSRTRYRHVRSLVVTEGVLPLDRVGGPVTNEPYLILID